MTDETQAHPLVVWRLLDGRRGHLTQIEGLTQAIADQASLDVHDLEIGDHGGRWLDWLLGRFPEGATLPPPALILAAGHRTHLAALAARRAHGGHIVVLMKPTLPLAWFDLCLIPEHDQPPTRRNVIATRGAITTVRPSAHHDPATGLILLGGPSRHHDWDDEAILEQVRQIIGTQPEVRFSVSDSPRTPAATRDRLAGTAGIDLILWEQCEPGYIQKKMQDTGQVWVSEDSVSMLYESLSSGAPTGLLQVPRRRETRISRGVDRLAETGAIIPFERWRTSGTLAPPSPLSEAQRCANAILKRWPADN